MVVLFWSSVNFTFHHWRPCASSKRRARSIPIGLPFWPWPLQRVYWPGLYSTCETS